MAAAFYCIGILQREDALAQAPACITQPAADRAHRNAEPLAESRPLEVSPVIAAQQLPGVRRQLTDQLGDHAGLELGLERTQRGARLLLVDRHASREPALQRSRLPSTAIVILELVARDRQQPAAKTLRIRERVEPSKAGEQGLLREIFGGFGVVDLAAKQPAHGPPVPLEQLRFSPLVTGERTPHQICIDRIGDDLRITHWLTLNCLQDDPKAARAVHVQSKGSKSMLHLAVTPCNHGAKQSALEASGHSTVKTWNAKRALSNPALASAPWPSASTITAARVRPVKSPVVNGLGLGNPQPVWRSVAWNHAATARAQQCAQSNALLDDQPNNSGRRRSPQPRQFLTVTRLVR
jgi:hypothetical protein